MSNKQIQRLIVRAHEEAGCTRRFQHAHNDFKQKFAELILQEVFDICKKQKGQSAFHAYHTGINEAMVSIAQHFQLEDQPWPRSPT